MPFQEGIRSATVWVFSKIFLQVALRSMLIMRSTTTVPCAPKKRSSCSQKIVGQTKCQNHTSIMHHSELHPKPTCSHNDKHVVKFDFLWKTDPLTCDHLIGLESNPFLLVKLCSVPADVFYLQHLIGTVQERKSKNLYPRVFFPLVLPLMLCGTVLLLQAKKIIWKWHKMWNKNCTSEVKQKRSNKLFRKQRWKFHLNCGIN